MKVKTNLDLNFLNKNKKNEYKMNVIDKIDETVIEDNFSNCRGLEDLQDTLQYINGSFTTVYVVEARKTASLCLVLRSQKGSVYYDLVGKEVEIRNMNLYPEQRRLVKHKEFREIEDIDKYLSKSINIQ